MSSRLIWPQLPLPAEPITDAGKPAVPPPPPKSYLEQLRQPSSAQVAPYVELLRERIHRDEATGPALSATERPLREALVQLLAHTLATGRETISGREIFWRLRVPPQREKQQGRDIARVLRSLGWVRCRYGQQSQRIWGWRWREWGVSAAVELPSEAIVHQGDVGCHPLAVRARRAPIIPIYGDDVPLSETTPEASGGSFAHPSAHA